MSNIIKILLKTFNKYPDELINILTTMFKRQNYRNEIKYIISN